MKVGEQNLYAQARNLVGDRDPRAHEFTVQLRAMDTDQTGALLGVPALAALCGAMLGKNTRGSTILVGALALGGSIEPLPNVIRIAEFAVEKRAGTLLLPVAARQQLNDRPDDV